MRVVPLTSAAEGHEPDAVTIDASRKGDRAAGLLLGDRGAGGGGGGISVGPSGVGSGGDISNGEPPDLGGVPLDANGSVDAGCECRAARPQDGGGAVAALAFAFVATLRRRRQRSIRR